MAFVLRVLDGLKELGIAPGAAAVCGRAAAVDLDQARIDDSGFGVGQSDLRTHSNLTNKSDARQAGILSSKA